MPVPTRLNRREFGLAIAAIAAAAPASAQSRGLTLIGPFAAGTAPDTLARLLADGMQRTGGPSAVVENLAGAGGQIAAGRLQRSVPDGNTLLIGEVGMIAMAPYAFASLPYDANRDFLYVSEIGRTDFALLVPKRRNHGSIKTFVERAKQESPLLMATFGLTSPGHIAAELFAQTGGFKLEPVHYRGVAEAMGDIGSARAAGAFVSLALASAQAKNPDFELLIQTGEKRSPLLPDVPTAREAGMPELTIASWFVLIAPVGTPPDAVERLQRAAAAAVKDPTTQEKLRAAGFEPVGSTMAEVRQMVTAEQARWKAVIEKAGIKVNN